MAQVGGRWRGAAVSALLALATGWASAQAPSVSLDIQRVWRYAHADTQVPGQKSEIVAFDDITDTLWVAGVAGVDVLDRLTGRLVAHIPLSAWGAVNSVAIRNGLAAMALENTADRSQNGLVVFFDTRTRQATGQPVTVGALPDMLTFTPDGQTVLVANEGTPNPRSSGQPCPVDPPGSVSLIDVRTRAVTTLPISPSIPGYAELRLFPTHGNGSTRPDMCPYDPEPEYIAVDPDGRRAYVILQEANGMAVLDLVAKRFEAIIGLGLKDFSLAGNGIDANDTDGVVQLVPVAVKGLYQPDTIATYRVGGQSYIVMANEGDSRDNGIPDGEDERRGSAGNASIELVPEGSLLSRLVMSNVDSSRGNLVTFGGRSFSIRKPDGTIVFDSGNQLDAEAIRRGIYDPGRSDNKGVEPEGVALLAIGTRIYAFIGLERTTQSAIAVYDVTNPAQAVMVDMIVSANDVSPEGLLALTVGRRHFFVVANEISDSTSLFEIRQRITVPTPVATPRVLPAPVPR